MGDFAEARRRLISKIEGCEETHLYMLKEHLEKRGVRKGNYYRLNVEVGVGEFGMNEWSRLADISTSTRRYLARTEVKQMNEEAALKLARIERAKRKRMNETMGAEIGMSQSAAGTPVAPPLHPLAVELPGDEGHSFSSPTRRHQPARYGGLAAHEDKFTVLAADDLSPASAGGMAPTRPSGESRRADDPRLSAASMPLASSPRRSYESHPARTDAPPLPPKTPINGHRLPPASAAPRPWTAPRINGHTAARLPYPDDDGPPPVVNMAGKPQFVPRQ